MFHELRGLGLLQSDQPDVPELAQELRHVPARVGRIEEGDDVIADVADDAVGGLAGGAEPKLVSVVIGLAQRLRLPALGRDADGVLRQLGARGRRRSGG